jgi:zinc transporter ZupT
MSDSKNLRIAGIFITMAASVFGFGIPYIRGSPKNHEEAVSARWMSLKSFSAGVILSVAFIHLLGEALGVLNEQNEAAAALAEALEEASGEHHEEEGGHAGHANFPVGLSLCLAGAAMTLGIEMLAGIFINHTQTSTQEEGDKALEAAQALNPTTDAKAQELCRDPYRLENGHTHGQHEEVQCLGGGGAGVELVSSGKIHPDQTKYGTATMDNGHGHGHSHEHAAHSLDDFNKTAAGGDMHRHVSIVIEDENRSILKSLLLEGAVAVHSVIIGVSLGGTEDYKALGVLLAAFTFHQIFEGISLGSASLQAGYSPRVAVAFMLIFALSVPVGMLIGLNVPATTNGQKVQAWFGCLAAGSLIYTAMVEMVAEDFAHLVHTHGTSGHDGGSKVKRMSSADKYKALYMYASFVAGLASMTVLAKWA